MRRQSYPGRPGSPANRQDTVKQLLTIGYCLVTARFGW
jgi:hypothetical protein